MADINVSRRNSTPQYALGSVSVCKLQLTEQLVKNSTISSGADVHELIIVCQLIEIHIKSESTAFRWQRIVSSRRHLAAWIASTTCTIQVQIRLFRLWHYDNAKAIFALNECTRRWNNPSIASLAQSQSDALLRSQLPWGQRIYLLVCFSSFVLRCLLSRRLSSHIK